MPKSILFLSFLCFSFELEAQMVEYEEYDLENGLHVILHQDNTRPIFTSLVMFHVGSKDEISDRTGFAHFFEHLLFEGTKHIERGEWSSLVSSNGGVSNAATTTDVTFYYETFPSNNLQLALWMESERMLHPVINQKGVDTQNEVVKEEKRNRYDNRSYGKIISTVRRYLFQKHPYRWSTIGRMDDLDKATLNEFMTFHKQYYVPNNATLVIAGDIDLGQTKKWIDAYFGDIPRGKSIQKNNHPIESPIVSEIIAEAYDPNIQTPAIVCAYRTPGLNTKDAKILNLVSKYLSSGKSSRMYKKMVDEKKMALEIGAFEIPQEDYGMYVIYALPMDGILLDDLVKEIDEEIEQLQKELIGTKEMEKLLHQVEMDYIESHSKILQIAESLAENHVLYGNTEMINTGFEIYGSITPEDLRQTAKKYLNKSQRLRLSYLPKASKEN